VFLTILTKYGTELIHVRRNWPLHCSSALLSSLPAPDSVGNLMVAVFVRKLGGVLPHAAFQERIRAVRQKCVYN